MLDTYSTPVGFNGVIEFVQLCSGMMPSIQTYANGGIAVWVRGVARR
jgi:hypothetical protein